MDLNLGIFLRIYPQENHFSQRYKLFEFWKYLF